MPDCQAGKMAQGIKGTFCQTWPAMFNTQNTHDRRQELWVVI